MPAGLKKRTKAQRALIEFYDLDESILAEAKSSPAMSKTTMAFPDSEWLKKQPETKKDGWLEKLLEDPKSSIRVEIFAEFQKSNEISAWPTKIVKRTLAEILDEAE